MKKIFVFFLLFAISLSLFADSSSSNTTIASPYLTVEPTLTGRGEESVVKNPFVGAWSFYLKVIVGTIGGAAVLLRFAFELVSAVIFEGEDSTSAVRKVLVRLLTHLGIIVIAFGMLVFIF